MPLTLTWKIWVLVGTVTNVCGIGLSAWSFFKHNTITFHPLGFLGLALIIVAAQMVRKGVKEKEKADRIALSKGS